VLTAVAVLASLAFVGWLVFRAVRQKPIKAHTIVRALAYVAGLYAFAFFFSMDIPRPLQVIVGILLGATLIVLGATLQRRRQPDKP